MLFNLIFKKQIVVFGLFPENVSSKLVANDHIEKLPINDNNLQE